MLRVPGTGNPPTSSGRGDDEQITEWHAKRFSNATDTSQEAPSIATTTASGYARRAADDANRDTLLAYWEAEQRRQRRDLAPATVSSPSTQRHSWASNRSAPRSSSSERRNLNAYRPVAGRWTSQIDDTDTVGLARTTDERVDSSIGRYEKNDVGTPPTTAAPPPSPPVHVTAAAMDSNKELHRKSMTPTPLETVEEQSVDEQALRSESSPTRSYRKPVPDHDVYDGASASSTAQSPVRRSFLPSHRRSATTESSGAASKRASEQSHLSAATGALHQHVERLRAGPQYHKDENGLHLLQALPETQAASSTSPVMHSTLYSNTPITFTQQQSPASLPPPPAQRRGRAWSLSLINKLKSRTRKSSDSSALLSARVPSFGRLDSPSLLTNKPSASTITDVRDASMPTISPLASTRREREAGQQQQHNSPPVSPSKEQRATQLYQLARRPLRKAAPTTASSQADVFTAARAPSGLVTAAVQSPTMQRTFSSTSQQKQRPASIASRRSSRSGRSSNGSLRNAASRKQEANDDKENTGRAVKTSPTNNASPSTAWWNPWSSRKNTNVGLALAGADDAGEWLDEPENAAGIHSPVAEDPTKRLALTAGDSQTSLQIINGAGRSDQLDAMTSRRGSANDGTIEVFAKALAAPLTASSSFSSLAPTPAPALVPPPRPNRRGKRTDSGSRRASSASSPTSPGMQNDETRFSSTNETSTAGDAGQSNVVQTLQAPSGGTLHITTSSSHRGSSVAGTEARESLLSDDLDYITLDKVQADGASSSDVLEEAATLNGYRASLPEARRQPNPHLSPVREMMTPDSRVLSDDRSGALSAASTVDQRTAGGGGAHRRISSGATMGRFLVHSSASVAAAAAANASDQIHERRPIPAPSVVAEPHANLSPVHRASSVSSSYGGGGGSTIAAGGGGDRGGDRHMSGVSSMKKNPGQTSELAELLAAVARKSAKQEGTTADDDNDDNDDERRNSRLRSDSMPSSAPRSPLVPSHATTIDNALAHRGSKTVRESWRSSVDGPWDGRVVSLSNVFQLPAARGLGVPSTATLRRQRSRSQPLNILQLDTEDGKNVVDDYLEEPPEAVPFAETAVQASLAALQALEMKEEAEKDGDWRARWASEKLLGFSASSQPGASLLGARWTKDHAADIAADDERLSKHARHTRRARRAMKSIDRPASRSDSRSSDSANGTTKVVRQPSGTAAEKSFNQDLSIDGLPPLSNRVISAAEWDETVVPAHAKRMSHGGGDHTDGAQHFGLMASGLVAPGSPEDVEFPTPTMIKEVDRQRQDSIIDHGSEYSNTRRSSHRRTKEKSSAHRRRQGSDRGDDSRSHRRKGRRRGGGGDGGEEGRSGASKKRHDRYPTVTSTAASIAKSSTKSRIVRRGYGCDDIVAWQSSLSIAALPSVVNER